MQSRAAKLGIGAIAVTVFLVFATVVVVAVLARVAGLWSFGQTETVDRSQPALLHSLEELSSYRAASGNFQIVVDLENDVAGVPDWLAGERRIMVAAGSVDAEVDFSGLDESAITIDAERTSATIVLPEPHLTEAELDLEKTYVAVEQRGFFDRFNDALSSTPDSNQNDIYLLAEDRLEAAATETELADQAEENTRDMLEGMLGGLGFTSVEVIFEPERRP